jgi:hypothetical protein
MTIKEIGFISFGEIKKNRTIVSVNDIYTLRNLLKEIYPHSLAQIKS